MITTLEGTAAPTYRNFVAGAWADADAGQLIERISPANGRLVSRYQASSAADVQKAVSAARRAFDNGPWPRMTGAERSRMLMKIAEGMRRDADTLVELEVAEVGKTIRLARIDISATIGLFEYAASLCQTMHGEAITNLGPNYTAMILREPVGVVGLIIPWNFPSVIFAQKVPFALGAGNTVVIKPSEFTSGTALYIARIAADAGLPEGVLNVVTGYGDPAGQALVESPGVDMISFTGGTATGRKVARDAAATLKKVSLELGGKSATTVFADADLDDAVDGAAFGIYFNAGQCCASGPRLLLEDSIADVFLEKLVALSRRVRVGDPANDDTDHGPLIYPRHLDKVMDYIEVGRKQGAELLTGGERLTGSRYADGLYVAPTVFDGVTQDMRIFREEIFGPVLSVTRFSGLDQALALANDTEYGLVNAVWTRDIDKAFLASRGLRSGVVWVNSNIDTPASLPFGGYKASGLGRENGAAGLDEFTEVKSVNVHLGPRNRSYPGA